MQVHIETFKHTGTETYPARRKGAAQVVIERHSVEVTINGDRRVVRASRDDKTITVYDLAVRFSQGSKVWPGSATHWLESGIVNGIRPNIDKRGHFILVGYASDFEDKAVRSQHNAVA